MTTCSAEDCDRSFDLLFFPEPVCYRHRSPQQRSLLADLDERVKRGRILINGWPYGPNINVDARQALVEWAENNEYRLAEPRRLCLHWLLGQSRRCGALREYDHEGMINSTRHEEHLDHVTCWAHRGRPALLLSQPYHYPPEGWVEQVTSRWPVDIEITEHGPWYGFGTHGILITPRSETP